MAAVQNLYREGHQLFLWGSFDWLLSWAQLFPKKSAIRFKTRTRVVHSRKKKEHFLSLIVSRIQNSPPPILVSLRRCCDYTWLPSHLLPYSLYTLLKEQISKNKLCKPHLAYRWRAWNLNWLIRIQQAGKILLSWRQGIKLTRKGLNSGNIAGDGIKYSRKGIYNSQNYIRL